MSEGTEKSRGVNTAGYGGAEQQPPPPPPPPQYYYGTFQGVANYPPPPPPQPVIGFPQPITPHGAPHHYPHGYQNVSGYAVVEGRPVREPRLPCCGIGIGWILFLIGFFLGAIPWYIGAFILLCVRVDNREKPGLIACTIAAILVVIAVSLGATKATHS
ncbi:large ribosomal subunit protein eL20z-like [Cornus florida]|uniref:large ribosomal subunit protein eL20z-like n=1 Tax=Cornus florida TaxID=4283 RepID=UPI0028A148D0|nr:large ribosomal subunit protein eL20z-like [Cornus florida]